VARIERMAAEGAAIVDVGGESTRPGAKPVSAAEEIDRVIPVIEAAREAVPLPISVDTSKPEVMRAAVAAGAGFINDVRALREPGALEAAVEAGVPVCLMHMRGEPRSMQAEPRYRDVVAEVLEFLRARRRACIDAGIAAGRILVDPGFGFGKSLDHNLALFRDLERFATLGAPLLVGVSRKSMIGSLLDRPAGERVHGSVAAALMAVIKGARIVRVHDVAPTVDALRILEAVSHP
jgi:dihydropteroate synthase